MKINQKNTTTETTNEDNEWLEVGKGNKTSVILTVNIILIICDLFLILA